MKTKGQYLLFNLAEFAEWLATRQFARSVVRIQNHHTWKPRYADFKGENHFQLLEGMYNYHVHTNGWANIGQNLTTFPDGLVAVCRPFDATPACIVGANTGSICIEHLGDFDSGRDTMSAAHAHCAVRVNALLCEEFGLTPNSNSIVYHHWYNLGTGERNNGTKNNKSCPGTAFFGGNKVADCEANFIPKVLADLSTVAGAAGGGAMPLVPLRRGRVASPDGILSVRNAPKASAKKLGELTNGNDVDIFETDGNWCRIDPAAARWIHGGYVVALAVDAHREPMVIPAAPGATFDFSLPKPSAGDLSKAVVLWGTYYYGQSAKAMPGGIPLRNKKDEVVGPSVSQRDWCLGAMEGTLVVTDADGSVATLNYEAKGTTAETSCRAFFPNLNPAILSGTERVRWHRAKGPFGDGAGGFILAPYRTWAVDRREIALGTCLYVAAARGVEVLLPDGTAAKHDGYFFAGDVGGAIKDNHVDFFLGITSKNPFTFVRSKPQHTFEAAVVSNAATKKFLRDLHTR